MRQFLLILSMLIGSVAIAQVHAVVEYSNTVYEITSADDATIKYSKRIKVLNEKGNPYGQLVDFHDKFRKITSASVLVHDANGKKVDKLLRKDGLSINFSESYTIDDSRIFLIDPKRRIYPYTVEIEYVVKSNGFIAFPSWYPQSSYNVEVSSASLDVRISPDADISLHPMNNMEEGKQTMEDGFSVNSWKLEDLKAIEQKPYAKPLTQTLPNVKVVPTKFKLDGEAGSFEDWVTFGNWYYNLNSDRGQLGEQTKLELKEMAQSIDDSRVLVDQIFQYMQDKTRYISIQLGIGGYQSLPVDFVDAKGYGDCKALSTYMRSMLQYVGIKSNYVLVNAGSNSPDILPEIPSNQFNHVFLAVPFERDTIWLECTSQVNPINYIGTFTDDRNVLWVAPDASKIIRTPKWKASDNKKISTARVTITEDGTATCDLDVTKQGTLYSDLFRYDAIDGQDMKKILYRKFPFTNYEVNDFSYETGEDSLILNEHYQLTIPDFAKSTGNRIVLRAGFLHKQSAISSEFDHEVPFTIRRGSSYVDSYEIEVPDNYRVTFATEPQAISSECGEYTLSIQSEDNVVRVERKMKVFDGEFEGIKFKEFIDKVRKYDNTKILLTSKT